MEAAQSTFRITFPNEQVKPLVVQKSLLRKLPPFETLIDVFHSDCEEVKLYSKATFEKLLDHLRGKSVSVDGNNYRIVYDLANFYDCKELKKEVYQYLATNWDLKILESMFENAKGAVDFKMYRGALKKKCRTTHRGTIINRLSQLSLASTAQRIYLQSLASSSILQTYYNRSISLLAKKLLHDLDSNRMDILSMFRSLKDNGSKLFPRRTDDVISLSLSKALEMRLSEIPSWEAKILGSETLNTIWFIFKENFVPLPFRDIYQGYQKLRAIHQFEDLAKRFDVNLLQNRKYRASYGFFLEEWGTIKEQKMIASQHMVSSVLKIACAVPAALLVLGIAFGAVKLALNCSGIATDAVLTTISLVFMAISLFELDSLFLFSSAVLTVAGLYNPILFAFAVFSSWSYEMTDHDGFFQQFAANLSKKGAPKLLNFVQ